MGSQGERRTGRAHLPKAGTRPDVERQLRERRQEALHPFAADPWRPRRAGYGVTAVVVIALMVLAIIGLIALT